MTLEELKEIEHGTWLYGKKEKMLATVITPPNKLEANDSKVTATVKIVTCADEEKVGEDIKIDSTNCNDFGNILESMNLISDPTLWATISYNAMIVDTIAHSLAQRANTARAAGQDLKSKLTGV